LTGAETVLATVMLNQQRSGVEIREFQVLKHEREIPENGD